jgi:hypothetical protein
MGKLSSTGVSYDFQPLTSQSTYFRFLEQPPVIAPPLTTTQRDALAVKKNGMIILNTTLGVYQGYKGTGATWVNLS